MYIIYKYPIYTKEGDIYGYELLLRNERGLLQGDNLSEKYTSIILNALLEEEPSRVFGNKKVFVSVSPLFLETAVFELLPSSNVVMKVKGITSVSERMVKLSAELIQRGFEIAIEDFGFEKVSYLPLLNRATYVTINPRMLRYSPEEFEEVVEILRTLEKKIIIKDLNREEDFRKYLPFGDLFQGKALSSPSPLLNVRSVFFLKNTIMRLYKALSDKDIGEIVRIIESDVGLTYKLLRWIRNRYPAQSEEIRDVGDAILFLSINDITNFVLALAMTEFFAGSREEEIIKRSLFRAHLAQELAKLYIPEYAKISYFIGLFSLINELLGEEPSQLARELNLGEEVVEAFERRYNEFGLLLSLIELLEENSHDKELWQHVAKLLKTKPESIKEAIEKARKEVEGFTL
ncbi:MAG: HDOD domain-containing protein [Aquificae bacterium]|nr:HDOD domain-containing protein [Aquificota bacterium]